MAVLDCARVSSEQEEVQESLEFSEGVTYREMSEQWVAGGGAMRAGGRIRRSSSPALAVPPEAYRGVPGDVA